MTYFLTENAKWVRVAFFAVLFMLIPQFLDWAYVKIMPQTHWVEYEALLIEDDVDANDTFIEVFSLAEIKRQVHVKWNDVLYCNKGTGFEFITSIQTEKTYNKPQVLPRSTVIDDEQVVDIPWRFPTEGKLVAGEKCYIEANVVAVVQGNQKEGQTVISNTFTVK